MIEVVGIRFKKAGKMYYFDPAGIKLEKEDGAIVETARGIEYGTVIKGNSFVPEEAIVPPLKQVMRRATEEDTKSVEQNHKKETEAFGICLEKISRLGLDMKLVDVEMTFDRNKLIFYFTSDGRVDFRELVKELAAVFRISVSGTRQRCSTASASVADRFAVQAFWEIFSLYPLRWRRSRIFPSIPQKSAVSVAD